LITSRGLMTLALSPFIILLASGTRLILISNYDTTTATTMAASGGLGETLLGTVIPLLPPFLPALLVIFAIFRQWWCLAFAAVATALVSPAYIGVHEGLRAAYSQFQDAISHAWHWQWHHLWQDSRLLIWCAALGAVFALWDNCAMRQSKDGTDQCHLGGSNLCACTTIYSANLSRKDRPRYDLRNTPTPMVANGKDRS
jgi:hypothetical protein